MNTTPGVLQQIIGQGTGNTKGGEEYHCTVDLLFDWFGISSMRTDNFRFYLQDRLIQTSQTGGQWNSDTSPFSTPCMNNPQFIAASETKKRKLSFISFDTRTIRSVAWSPCTPPDKLMFILTREY